MALRKRIGTRAATAALRGRRSVSNKIERLESRLLMSTNSWNSAVSGDWDDASKWSAGHVPTAAELKAGRAPTYEEGRCMTYLALTHGAKGLIYYCYYDLRVLPQYQEMWGWMKSIAAEVKALSPMLLSPEDLGAVDYAPAAEKIHTRLKRYNGQLYLMAVNAGSNPCRITFKPGRKLSREPRVMFEERCLKTANAQLTDDFKPLEAHVYELGR